MNATAPRNTRKRKLSIGIDLVSVTRIAESLDAFGDRFLTRVFTDAEIAYATGAESPLVTHQRLAARFAAKEAALKALDLIDVGLSWRDIEVERLPSGACELRLHGKARALTLGEEDNIALSLSHEGDFATAVVVTQHP